MEKELFIQTLMIELPLLEFASKFGLFEDLTDDLSHDKLFAKEMVFPNIM